MIYILVKRPRRTRFTLFFKRIGFRKSTPLNPYSQVECAYLHGSWLQHGNMICHTKNSPHLSTYKSSRSSETVNRFTKPQHGFTRWHTHAIWTGSFWLVGNVVPCFEIICIDEQRQIHCVCCALGYHGVNSSYHTSFVMVYRVFSEVAIKGHCFPKTLYQPSPRLGFSSDLGASLRIHANTAVFSLDSFPVLMVRLFLFRVGSLLALFALLVWEAFYRPSGDSFTGTYNRKTKIT